MTSRYYLVGASIVLPVGAVESNGRQDEHLRSKFDFLLSKNVKYEGTQK
jgi:hypothetical protein